MRAFRFGHENAAGPVSARDSGMALRWLPLLLLAMLLGACSRGSTPEAQSVDATPEALLGSGAGGVGKVVWSKTSFPIALPEHWVVLKGTLGVNKAGCVTIGRDVVWAPQGSRLVDGGSAVLLRTRGTFRIGDAVQLVGTEVHYKSSTTVDRVASRCALGAPTMEVASLYRARETPTS